MKREIIKASAEHEKSFRETFELRPDIANDPEWIAGFEYAATHKLHADEMMAIGAAIVRKVHRDPGESGNVRGV